MIEVECECGRVIKTKDENAGKKARCPDCGEVVQIPAPRKAGSKSPAASAAKSTRKRPPSEDEFDGEDEDFDDEEEAEEQPRSRSKKVAGKKPVRGKAEPEEPVSKKKKKKKKGEDTDLNKNIIIGTCVVFGIAFLGLVGYGLSKLGSISAAPAVEVPKDFAEFSTPNGELRCQGPKGWQHTAKGGSGGVSANLTIEKDNIRIKYISSPSGASFQMIAQAGGADESKLPDEEKPVFKIHEIQRKKFESEDASYQEQGPPEMIKTANSEGCISAYTASEGLSKVFAYRVTLLGTNNQWIGTFKCSASQWKDFQPVFRKIIESTNGT